MYYNPQRMQLFPLFDNILNISNGRSVSSLYQEDKMLLISGQSHTYTCMLALTTLALKPHWP